MNSAGHLNLLYCLSFLPQFSLFRLPFPFFCHSPFCLYLFSLLIFLSALSYYSLSPTNTSLFCSSHGWLRRCWPGFDPGCLFLCCMIVSGAGAGDAWVLPHKLITDHLITVLIVFTAKSNPVS